MGVEKQYEIDFNSIESAFKFGGNFAHSQGKRYKMLPFTGNDSKLVSNFNGVIGAFSRTLCKKVMVGEFEVNSFVDEVTQTIGEFDSKESEMVFKDLVISLFLNKDSLVGFDIKTLNYINSTFADQKIAEFLYSVFYDERLNQLAKTHYEKEAENILHKLVIKALPELKDQECKEDQYVCQLPFIKDLFIHDFAFLIEHEELYKESIKRFLEYYYMFYVSQLCMKLSKFENADFTTPDRVFYTLGWESTSKNRTAYKYGWTLLNSNTNALFSHAITLEFLNHHNLGENHPVGYHELYKLINHENASQIKKLYEKYTNQITDKKWETFKPRTVCNNPDFAFVYLLFDAIEYQFEKTSRSRANDAYKNWFVKFVQDNFAKKRGALGYNLNLTEEDVILFTKICINENKKLKLNVLFIEFEKRGLFLDKDSKQRVVHLYEKLNILEKKSDSGDAQYVRSVL